MRVAIVNFTGGGFSGGYVKYLRSLLPLLHADRRIDRLDVFVPPQGAGLLALPPVPLLTWPEGDPLWGFRALKRQLRALQPDVIFVPTARWIACGQVPVVTMVRNMEPLQVPIAGTSIPTGLRNLARAFAARRACRRATRVIAISNHVRDFLAARWRISGDKIGVVYHGVERASACGPSQVPAALATRNPGRFIFTAGSIRPARGLEDVIDVTVRLRGLTPPPALVIAGAPDAGTRSYHEHLKRRARTLGVDDLIIWTGALSPAEMWWCFDACAAFVMTSRAEAGPNTALEAMSRGCVTVSVDHAPMPEFFGATALYYRAGDIALLTRQLSSVLAGDPSMSELRAAAVRRADEFDWNRTASGTVSQLRMALST